LSGLERKSAATANRVRDGVIRFVSSLAGMNARGANACSLVNGMHRGILSQTGRIGLLVHNGCVFHVLIDRMKMGFGTPERCDRITSPTFINETQ
jgi:hypothetical protein